MKYGKSRKNSLDLIDNILYSQWMPNAILFILSALVFVSFFAQIIYVLYNESSVIKYAKREKDVFLDNPFVSVIIAAKNEEQNLESFLTLVLEQNYPNFEVIVINDGSEDYSQVVLQQLSMRYENLRIISVTQAKGKKNALKYGIESAQSEYLLFTDADCYPVSKNWIKSLVSSVNNKCEIVLAYGAYETNSGLLSKFVAYDTYLIALQYLSSAVNGNPYMGVGRNLLYKKSLWKIAGGFEKHEQILSGDDDLFISEVANSQNTRICIDKESFTKSIPPSTYKAFVNQKSRHLSTSGKYTLYAKFFTSFYLTMSYVFYLTSALLLFTPLWIIVFGIILMRILSLFLISRSSRNLFNIEIGFHNFVLFDIFAPVFYLAVIFAKCFIYRKNRW